MTGLAAELSAEGPFALSLVPSEKRPNRSKGSSSRNNNNNNDYGQENPADGKEAFDAAVEWQHDGNQPDRARHNDITLDYIDRHMEIDGGSLGWF